RAPHGDVGPDDRRAENGVTSRLAYCGKALATLIVAGAILTLRPDASAAIIDVAPGGDSLTRAVAAASAGDVLKLSAGIYDGPVRIDRALTLEGSSGAVIDG